MAELDRLEIAIEAKASKANAELDKLAGKLEKVASSLININGDGLTKFACSIDKFAKSSRALADVNTDGLTRLMNSIGKISNVDTKQMAGVAAALKEMAKKINALPTVSENAAEIGRLVKNISSLGGKSALSAIDNMPRLAKAMQQLMTTLSKAPQVSQNLITMTTALTDFTKSCRGLSGIAKQPAGTLSGLTTSFPRLIGQSRRATGSIRSFSQIIGTFYAKCFMLIRGVKALGKSIESSMDYIETYNYFNVITDKIGAEFGNAWKENGYSSAEEYSKSFRKRLNNLTTQMTGFNIGDEGGLYMSGNVGLGLDPEKIMAYQANISSITNAVGLMGETSVNTSKALTMLAADLSSLKNQDLESVMKNLQSGLIGQSRALYKYGIDITNNTLQTYAYANGIDKAVQEMTQAEKMQLRLLAILDQSKVAYGDMANTIRGVANQFRIFKQQVSNLARIIGNLFIPVLQTVLPYINGFIIALQRLFTWIGNLLGVKWENLMDGISSGYTDTGLEELYDNAEDVTDALEDANKAANKLKKTIHSYDELHVASDPNSGNENTSIGGSGGIDLSGAIADALADYEKVWNEAMKKMENKAQEIADKISAYFKKIHAAWLKDADMSFIGEDIGNALNNLLYSIDWESIKQIAYKIGKSLSTALSGFLRTTDWREVGTAIAESLNTLVKFVKGAIENFDFHALGLAIVNAVNGFFANFDFADAADALNKFVDGLGEALKTFLAEVDWENVFKGLYDFVSNLELDTIAVVISGFALKWVKKKLTLEALKTFIFGGLLAGGASTASGGFLGSAVASGGVGLLTFPFGILIALTGAKIVDEVNDRVNTSEWGIADWVREPIEMAKRSYQQQLDGLKINLELWWQDTWMADKLWNFEQWWNDKVSPWFTTEKWSELWENVKTSFTTKWGEIIAWWDSSAIGIWWSEHVSPYFEETDWTDLFSVIHNSLQCVWGNLVNWWNSSAVGKWWSENVTPYFKETDWTNLFSVIQSTLKCVWGNLMKWWESSTLGKWWKEKVTIWFRDSDWSNLFSVIRKTLEKAWKGLVSWWESSALCKWWRESVSPWFNTEKWNFKGIKEGLGKAFDAAIDGVKQIWNRFANWLNRKLNFTIKPIKILGFTLFPGATIDLGKLPTFQTGGFPEDGLFMANHNELVGKFSNGKTAVINNEQIVESVARGVESAVTNGMMNVFMATQGNSNTDDNREVHVHVHIGNDELGVATFKGMRDAARRGLIPKFV